MAEKTEVRRLEQASTYAKTLIETLVSVHALACMYRSSGHPEYANSAARWIPSLESQFASLTSELKAMEADNAAR